MEIGVVEGIDVSAQGLAEGVGQLVLVLNRGDGFKLRPQRRQPLALDGGLVHVRVV